MSFKNFVLNPPSEILEEIEKLKNLVFELKEGKKFGLKLTNKNTNQYWISSTNNLKQREATLKNILTKKDEWNGPWRDIFSDLPTITILDYIDFQYIDDISLIDAKDLFYQNFSTEIDLEKIKISFLALIRLYLKGLKIDQKKQSDLRNLVDSYFKKKSQSSLQLANLAENIDKFLN